MGHKVELTPEELNNRMRKVASNYVVDMLNDDYLLDVARDIYRQRFGHNHDYKVSNGEALRLITDVLVFDLFDHMWREYWKRAEDHG